MTQSNTEIAPGYFIYQNSEGGKKKGKLGGGDMGPYAVLDLTELTFVIQLRELVERVKIYLVTPAVRRDN